MDWMQRKKGQKFALHNLKLVAKKSVQSIVKKLFF